MFRRLTFVAMTCLLVLLPLGACTAQRAATPAPTQVATKATPAVDSPALTKAPEAKPTKPHEQVNVRILAMTLGGAGYVLSFALAEILNKTHPWLRAAALETQGPTANLMTLANDPEARKSNIGFTQESANSIARQGLPPFKTPYTGARVVAAFAETTVFLVTLDKNIKSKADMDGKRVMTFAKGAPGQILADVLFNDVWGIKPRVSSGSFEATRDAMKDGLIDVGNFAANATPGVGYFPVPSLDELMTMKDVYFINVPVSDIEAMANKGKIAVHPTTIPAKAMGVKQPAPVEGWAHANSWWADEGMSDEIVYEITKCIYENADKFKEYHKDGQLVTPKTVARIGVPEELFHPGALKFYREKGIKPGIN